MKLSSSVASSSHCLQGFWFLLIIRLAICRYGNEIPKSIALYFRCNQLLESLQNTPLRSVPLFLDWLVFFQLQFDFDFAHYNYYYNSKKRKLWMSHSLKTMIQNTVQCSNIQPISGALSRRSRYWLGGARSEPRSTRETGARKGEGEIEESALTWGLFYPATPARLQD